MTHLCRFFSVPLCLSFCLSVCLTPAHDRSGPSFAREIAMNQATAVVIASDDSCLANDMAKVRQTCRCTLIGFFRLVSRRALHLSGVLYCLYATGTPEQSTSTSRFSSNQSRDGCNAAAPCTRRAARCVDACTRGAREDMLFSRRCKGRGWCDYFFISVRGSAEASAICSTCFVAQFFLVLAGMPNVAGN